MFGDKKVKSTKTQKDFSKMVLFMLDEKLFLLIFVLSPIFFANCEAVDKAHTYWMTRNSRLQLSPSKQQNYESLVRLIT